MWSRASFTESQGKSTSWSSAGPSFCNTTGRAWGQQSCQSLTHLIVWCVWFSVMWSHLSGTGVEHVTDSSTHLKDQLTCSSGILRALRQVGEHECEESIIIGHLWGHEREVVTLHARHRRHGKMTWAVKASPFSSKKRSSQLQSCGCVPFCEPGVYCKDWFRKAKEWEIILL